MNMRKLLSIFLAFVLVLGVFAPCFPVWGAEESNHQHTYGQWSFDTAKGTQSRTCSGCNAVQTLHGTTNKAEQVTAPAIGSQYYLAANVAGTLKYFIHGTVTNTTPNSLVVTEDTTKAQQITIEDPSAVAESTGVGFQMTYPNPNTSSSTKTLRIHCMGTGAAANTGAAAQATKGRTTFIVDEVGGVKVLRKTANNNILVVKYNTTRNEWRMLGVPESELANEGVYPAMLVVNHTHSYGTTYEKDNTHHWKVCDCGYTTTKEAHDFTNGPCVCGFEQTPHDCQSADGKWFIEGNKHYQVCGICSEKINEAEHTYGGWSFDAQKGTQSKLCTACRHAGETLHGTDNKVTQVIAPQIGGSYYLVANVGGSLHFFVNEGSVT